MRVLNNKVEGKQNYRTILHIDRLQFTLKHENFSFFSNTRNPDNISERQSFGEIELVLDNSKGSAMYYHTFALYFKGKKVGKLHSASKFNRPHVEFDFDKHVLYSVKKDWWYEIYNAILSDLGLHFSNINKIELALDSTKDFLNDFSYIHSNSINNKLNVNSFYEPVRKINIDVLNNGNAFNIAGSCNMISIYKKSSYREEFVDVFFKANGFIDQDVFRVESRMNWNYLKSVINKKSLAINPETLLNDGMLAMLFQISVKNKLSYHDLRTKHYNKHRNVKYDRVSILDDLEITTTDLLTFNTATQIKHYKNKHIDELIIKQTFFQYIETGKEKYFDNIRNCSEAALFNDTQVIFLLKKFTLQYNGDSTTEIKKRMTHAIQNYQKVKKKWAIAKLFRSIGFTGKYAE